MMNRLIGFWQAFKELALGAIFVVACLATGAGVLTAIFGRGFMIKIGPTFEKLPDTALETFMVAGLLWVVFGVLYLIRIICKKYAKNR